MLHLVIDITLAAIPVVLAVYIWRLKSSASKPPSVGQQLEALVHTHCAELCSVCKLSVHRFTSTAGVVKCANCIAEGK